MTMHSESDHRKAEMKETKKFSMLFKIWVATFARADKFHLSERKKNES